MGALPGDHLFTTGNPPQIYHLNSVFIQAWHVFAIRYSVSSFMTTTFVILLLPSSSNYVTRTATTSTSHVSSWWVVCVFSPIIHQCQCTIIMELAECLNRSQAHEIVKEQWFLVVPNILDLHSKSMFAQECGFVTDLQVFPFLVINKSMNGGNSLNS